MHHCMNIRKFATITVLVVSSFAATNVSPTKAELDSMYDKAFREFSAANYEQALKELDAIDARQPDLAESQNLRGVILMRQAKYDEAEAALQKRSRPIRNSGTRASIWPRFPSFEKSGRKRGSVLKDFSRAERPNSRAKPRN
jgi:predicted Zn-dependent protease